MHALDALFRPQSVAIVGASNDPNKVGGRPLAFLKKAGWAGRILPVNPTAREVQGIAAFASLEAIEGGIDQAIIAVPAAQVLATVRQCIARGVRALQVFSSGFGEGPDAAQGQLQLQAMAREAGVRILGPNSLGLFNAVDGFFGTFATALDGAWPRAGGIGVATQSGAFGSYFFGMAQQRGLGFSHFVATGNEADVDVADCIAFLAQDAATRLIVMAVEGCKDGRKLEAALHQARAAGKPVLAMKVGVSTAGAQAAATHTGALAGEDRVFDAVLRGCGAHRAGSLQELVDAAHVATAGPLPPARSLLVVTTSGGIGVLAADAAEAFGLALPAIDNAALAAIEQIAPLAGGRNPVDTSAGILGDLAAYARIAGHALASQPCGAVLCYLAHVPRNAAHWAQLRAPLYALRAAYPQIAFAVVALADAAVEADLQAHGFATFTDPTAAVRALAACAPMHVIAGLTRNPAGHVIAGLTRNPDGAGISAAPVPAWMPGRARHDNQGSDALPLIGDLSTETAAKQALATHGITFAPERAVRDAGQAAAAGRALGYPVVLKIVSPDIAHKTEAGGVQLGIQDEDTLRAALPAMQARVEARCPGARLEGFLVARQLTGGVEILVGTKTDPAFGPVVTVAAGGVLAELIDDICVRPAPVDAATALQMLHSLRIARLLQGWRGAPPCDMEALAQQVATLSQIAWASRGHIASIDLNPVLALPDGAYALDALVHRAGEHA
jgi:acyl-CoA synthetase (NDP forming)